MSDRPAETEYSAMQALLQMQGVNNGACSVRSGEDAAVGGDASSFPAATNTNHNTAAIHAAQAKLANMLRTGVSPSAVLQQVRLPFPPSQLAALQVASAQHQRSTQGNNSAGFGTASFHSVLMQLPPFPDVPDAARPEVTLQRPYLEAIAQNPSLGSALSRLDCTTASGAAANAGMLRPPEASPHGPSASAAAMASPVVTIPGIHASHATLDGEMTSAEKKAIRKDEVEAALRSKPQRGRKRENLNSEERLELTRSRNREHAKSTRIRKKARYQELLDTEQKYLQLQDGEELDRKRRQAIAGFLQARAEMLKRAVKSTTEKSINQAAKGEAGKSEDKENISNSFETHTGSSTEVKDSSVASRPTQIIWGDFLDEENFRFESSLGEIDVRGVNSVKAFDEHVAARFEDGLGPDCGVCIRTSYTITGSSDGIAFNGDGTGFAQVNLLCTLGSENRLRDTHEKEEVLLPSVVSFGFSQGSSKISAVAWCVLKDTSRSCSNCASVMSGGKSESTSKESLESQTVYPSVVSFEGAGRGKDHTSQHHGHGQSDEELEVPGMSLV